MNNHKISVIIPVYNAEKYLEKCLRSVVGQTISKEIICIDDGSADKSIGILEEYASIYPEIKIIRSEHKGTGTARNIGIKAARGEFVAFMDADDYYPDNQVLIMLYNMAINKGVPIVGGNIISVDDMGHEASHGESFDYEGFYDYMKCQDIYGFKKYIYSRELFSKDRNGFPPYTRFEDPPFFMNIMANNPIFYACPKCVYCHRVSYKTVEYTHDVALGMLCGVRDAFISAYKYKLSLAYDKYLKDKLREHLKNYYQYLYLGDVEFWNIITEICGIEKKWLGEVQWPFNREDFSDCIDYYMGLKRELMDLTKGNVPVIVYGAGVGGREVRKAFFDGYKNMIGYAVTDPGRIEIEDIEGCPVRSITEYMDYRDEATVIISIKDMKTQEEICNLLYRIGFSNVIRVYKDIKWLMNL